MTASRVRADYERLAHIAQSFSRQAETTQQVLRLLKSNRDILQSGQWVGKNADKFYREMEASVLPALNRLIAALKEAEDATQKISQVMKQAEDEAAKVFKLDGTAAGPQASGNGAPGAVAGRNLFAFARTEPGAGQSQGGVYRSGSASGSQPAAKKSATPMEMATEVAGAALAGTKAAIEAVNDLINAANAAAFDAIFSGQMSKNDAPDELVLPADLNKGLQDIWKESYDGKGDPREMGGILVRTRAGQIEWRRGEPGTRGGWSPNYDDIGDDEYIGAAHTHPNVYNGKKHDPRFRDLPMHPTDIKNMFVPSQGSVVTRVTIVQSGDTQFVMARTPEFDRMIDGKSWEEIVKLESEMTKLFNDHAMLRKDDPRSFGQALEAGARAVADKYGLLFYKGKNGVLVKQ